ncbi:AAA family ATPase [Lacibacterium aquatile]|uniref:AAA family ATPase n=1 Tax=Lacibacterium aquatile TaxID=1168082 RepID=A0ABW5DT84_9PROT
MAPDKIFRHGLIVGKFAPFHKGHQYLIDRALKDCGQLTVLVYANPDFGAMPQAVRAAWIKALYPDITVLQPLDPPVDTADDFTHRDYVRHYLLDKRIEIDAVFTSEDYGDGFANHLGVTHRSVDRQRLAVPASGTQIRADVHAHHHLLDPAVYRHFIQKIVLMGAESTGKSTLAKHLAETFQTVHVPEYGRELWEQKKGQLELADYVQIAQEHQRREDEALKAARRFLFIDTNAITTLALSYYYNGGALPELHAIARNCISRYHRWLVCADDIPFEQDGWRDTEILRTKMQRMILYDLTERGIRFDYVEGSLAQRIATVRRLLDGPLA